jgi:putative membrane protein insertion efficiency factor
MKTLWHYLRRLLVMLLVLPIRFYQTSISPLTPPSCRFTPSCSEYARQAIIKHGPFKGLYLAIWRILRCNPWGGSGYDPVPYDGGKSKKMLF